MSLLAILDTSVTGTRDENVELSKATQHYALVGAEHHFESFLAVTGTSFKAVAFPDPLLFLSRLALTK